MRTSLVEVPTKKPKTMMQELINTLQEENCPLAVLHEGNISTFQGRGVRHLYNIMQEQPELLLGAKIAVKAVGRSSARMMCQGGVTEVWAEYISQQAYDLLHDAGIRVSYEHKVDHNKFLDIWERLQEYE